MLVRFIKGVRGSSLTDPEATETEEKFAQKKWRVCREQRPERIPIGRRQKEYGTIKSKTKHYVKSKGSARGK
jgi:hypothetical protein